MKATRSLDNSEVNSFFLFLVTKSYTFNYLNVILCCWHVIWHLLTDMVVMFTNIYHYFKLGLVNMLTWESSANMLTYIYIYIYIYIRVLLVHKIQEIYGYALFVWWITFIYLYDHVCIHLIEVCIIVLKKRKWQIYAKIYPLHNLFHVW